MAEEEHEHTEKVAPKEITVKVNRKALWIGMAALVVVVLASSLFYRPLRTKIWKTVAPATAQVTIIADGQDGPIVQSTVILGDQTVTSDDKGVATVKGLWVGSFDLTVSSPGYVTEAKNMKLHRGVNAISVTLSPDVHAYLLRGTVTDYVSERPLSGVTISVTKIPVTYKSDQDGAFAVTAVPAGNAVVHLVKDGYIEADQTVVSNDTPVNLTLTPVGKTVFVSNRDAGKRGLYVSSYDGKDAKALIARSDGTEDYDAVVGPHNILVAFLSTRDKRIEGSSTYYDPKLYIVGTDGKGMKKLTDDAYVYNVQWSADGKYLAWIGDESADSSSPTHVRLYDPIRGTTTTLDSSGQAGNFWFSHDGTKVVWSQQQLNGSGDTGIFVRDLNTSTTKTVTTNGNAYNVLFSVDDTSVSYQWYDSSSQQSAYRSFNVDSGETSLYTPDPSAENRLQFPSPDGKTVAYIEQRDGQTDLFLSDPSGANEHRLTQVGTLTGVPTWDQTGKYLLVDSVKTGETARYVVATAGGYPKKVADISIESGGMGY